LYTIQMTEQAKRKNFQWNKLYSNYTQQEAEVRLNTSFKKLVSRSVHFSSMLPIEHSGNIEIKEKVYERLVERIHVEGYPTPGLSDFKEPNVVALIDSIIVPVLHQYQKQYINREIELRKQKYILSDDKEFGGFEELVIIELVDDATERILFIIEAKPVEVITGLKQCTLAMKNIYDMRTDDVPVYGFISTGTRWTLLRYDGDIFTMSEEINTIFPTISSDKTKWMKDCSVIVDIIFKVLDQS
jgi:hypothetical protein